MRHAARALVAMTLLPCYCLAESGFVDTLPNPSGGMRQMGAAGQRPAPASSTSGLKLTVDSRWACDYGYRPVRFTFESPKPAAGDRLITVSLREYTWRSSSYSLVVEEDFTLPAGATSATLTMAVPQLILGNPATWRVWVDGASDPALSRSLQASLQQNVRQDRDLNVLAADNLGEPRGRTNPLLEFFTGGSRRFGGLATNLTLQPLPERWLLYSGLDVVVMTVDEVQMAAEREPRALDALRRWLAAGGVLWLEGAGDGYRRLPGAAGLLGVNAGPRLLPEESAEGPLPDSPEWTWVRLQAREQRAREQREQGMIIVDGQPVDDGDSEAPLTSEGMFAYADCGLGAILAFERSVSSALGDRRSPVRKRAAFNHLAGQMAWPWRHGLTPDAANADFSNLLPPGAGRAPVTLFRVLITLFVLAAGPLNFWALARRQRMHLMVLTVPLTAALLTLSLLSYAVLAEGFGVQVRARSLTLLDQPRGELAVWSRNSYYAGIAPAEGLVFPAEAAVYPVLPGWNDPSSANAAIRQRTVDWQGDRQRLTRGWLPSRESTQLLALQSQPTDAGIEFQAKEGLLRATCRLGADATLLVVRDQAGEFWIAERLEDGQPRELKQAAKLEALTALRSLVSAAEPMPPPGLEEGDQSGLLGSQMRQRRRQFRNDYGIEYAPVRLDGNLLNAKIDQLIGLKGNAPLSIPPRSYVALTEETGWFSLGLEDAREEESFHVVIGSW